MAKRKGGSKETSSENKAERAFHGVKKEKLESYTIKLPPKLMTELGREAESRRISRAKLIRSILRDWELSR